MRLCFTAFLILCLALFAHVTVGHGAPRAKKRKRRDDSPPPPATDNVWEAGAGDVLHHLLDSDLDATSDHMFGATSTTSFAAPVTTDPFDAVLDATMASVAGWSQPPTLVPPRVPPVPPPSSPSSSAPLRLRLRPVTTSGLYASSTVTTCFTSLPSDLPPPTCLGTSAPTLASLQSQVSNLQATVTHLVSYLSTAFPVPPVSSASATVVRSQSLPPVSLAPPAVPSSRPSLSALHMPPSLCLGSTVSSWSHPVSSSSSAFASVASRPAPLAGDIPRFPPASLNPGLLPDLHARASASVPISLPLGDWPTARLGLPEPPRDLPPPLDPSLLTAIQNGEFVNFDQLLASTQFGGAADLDGAGPMVVSVTRGVDGRPALDISERVSHRSRVRDFQSWTLAYTWYMRAAAHYRPHDLHQLIQYQGLIGRFAALFSTDAWLRYDRAFRRRAALDPTTRWSVVDEEIYSMYLRGAGAAARNTLPGASSDRPACFGCGGVGHFQSVCPSSPAGDNARLAPRQSPGRAAPARAVPPALPPGVCFRFNRDGCTTPHCAFRHVCGSCGAPGHGWRACTTPTAAPP